MDVWIDFGRQRKLLDTSYIINARAWMLKIVLQKNKIDSKDIKINLPD